MCDGASWLWIILDSAVEASAPRSGERQQADSASTAEFWIVPAGDRTERDQGSQERWNRELTGLAPAFANDSLEIRPNTYDPKFRS
jgi:hypothetical protein